MLLLLPVGVNYETRRYPVVTFTLMGICTAVYFTTLALASANGKEVYEWTYENLWLVPSESHWWAYFTSMFVHGGFFHLLGNMIYLFLFGCCVEDLIGRVQFIVFYFLCGLAATFAFLAMSPDHFSSDIPLGGASGAISGCLGGFVILLASTQIEFKWLFWFWFRLFTGEFMLPAWLVISFWFLEDFALMLLTNSYGSHGGGVAFAAHVGGTVFGLAYMLILNLWLKKRRVEEPAPVMMARPAARMRSTTAPRPEIAETPTIYLLMHGAQAGPFTTTQVQEMFTLGSIPDDTLYWQEGMEDWREAGELRAPGLV